MKYIIDIPDNTHWIQWIMEGTKDHHPYMDWIDVKDLRFYTEHDRKAIEDEVWEFARGLLNYTDDDWEVITNMLLLDIPYQEAKAKYEAWLKQKDEIHVGDEVIPTDTQYDPMIVTRIWMDDHSRDCLDTLGLDGCICSFLTSNVKKTGRHFPEVAELLEKMRGEEK